VGTGAAFGKRWGAVRQDVARALGLRAGPASWQSMRDSWMNLLLQLALAAGIAAKIAGDIALMAQSEIGEAVDPSSVHGLSSAMPHKRNPVLCMRIRACGHVVQGLAAGLLSTIPGEHERGLGTWQAELALAPALVAHAVSALDGLAALLSGVRFDAARARRNIDETLGRLLDERAIADAVSAAARATRELT
jgi:3-carboxy-cis,cis-muconate cycloisomerase